MSRPTRRDILISGAAGLVAAAAAGCAARGRPEDPDDLRIWDLHCHLSQDLRLSGEEAMAELVTHADRMGIERLIVLSFGPVATPDEMRRTNDRTLRALESRPSRALGFVFLNPNHVDESLRELDRCVRDGPMVGVKLHVQRRSNARELDPIIARAAGLRAVVYQHTWLKTTGNEGGESTPADLVELSARHPGASLICGHAGGTWELGIRTLRPHARLCMAVEGFDPTAGAVEMAVRELGAERVIYGSDVTGRSYASQLAKVLGADIPEEARRRILGGNLRRLLGPILAAKGIPS